MSRYIKRPVTGEVRDMLRIQLSVCQDKLSPEPVCDFCGDPYPILLYMAQRMSTGQEQLVWRWTACESCSQLIDQDNRKAIKETIERRMIRVLGHDTPRRMIIDAVNEAFKAFETDVYIANTAA